MTCTELPPDLKIPKMWLGVVGLVCNPSTWEVEAGGLSLSFTNLGFRVRDCLKNYKRQLE